MPFVIHSLDLHLFSAGNVESCINLYCKFGFSFSAFGSSGVTSRTNHANLLCPLLNHLMSSATELSLPRCPSNKLPLYFVKHAPFFLELFLVFLISQFPKMRF